MGDPRELNRASKSAFSRLVFRKNTPVEKAVENPVENTLSQCKHKDFDAVDWILD
jgi:hypothetical protein